MLIGIPKYLLFHLSLELKYMHHQSAHLSCSLMEEASFPIDLILENKIASDRELDANYVNQLSSELTNIRSKAGHYIEQAKVRQMHNYNKNPNSRDPNYQIGDKV